MDKEDVSEKARGEVRQWARKFAIVAMDRD